ncbi:MAG: NAD(P)-dependent oxidoreductase [Promethearchaeota archaeon]
MREKENIKSNFNKEVEICFISDIPEQVKNYFLNQLKQVSNVRITFPKDYSEENLIESVSEADILIGWRPSKNILSHAKKLKVFINPGAGIHHLINDFKEINKERNVILINGHGNSYFVAQHTIALLLALMNKIILHHNWMNQGIWRTGDKEAASIPLRFRKIGLLGYGAINQKIHKMLSGFNNEFHILRRDWNKQSTTLPTEVVKYESNQLHEFLEIIDILIIALPVTSLTKEMIKERELELLGSTGLLVNVSRGEIINEEDLYFALRNRKILGAAIDVWYNYEPQSDKEGKKYPFNFPFHELDNIVLSPHRGYSPFKDLLRWDEIIENIRKFARGKQDLKNTVSLINEY